MSFGYSSCQQERLRAVGGLVLGASSLADGRADVQSPSIVQSDTHERTFQGLLKGRPFDLAGQVRAGLGGAVNLF